LTISYAKQRRIIDADSHLIELDDFLDLASGREPFAKRKSNPEFMADVMGISL